MEGEENITIDTSYFFFFSGSQSSIGVVSIVVIAVLLVVGTLLNIAICVAHVVVVHAARKKSGTSQRE